MSCWAISGSNPDVGGKKFDTYALFILPRNDTTLTPKAYFDRSSYAPVHDIYKIKAHQNMI